MITIQGDEVIVDAETTRLEGFRLEDTSRAPVIIVFIDEQEAQLVPLPQGGDIILPTKLKSKNAEVEIQIISFEEIQSTLAARS